MSQEPTLTVQEAAQRLSVSLDSLYRLLRSGRLAGSKRGKLWEISEIALQNYLEATGARRRGAPRHADLLDRLTPEREQQLAESGRCPVCGGNLFQEAPADSTSGWAHEFLECSDCGFSFHEHAVSSPVDLHRLVGKHLVQLEKYIEAGRRARLAVNRRRRL